MDARTRALKRFAAGPLQGVGLVAYFVALPILIVTRWRSATGNGHPLVLRTLLVVLALFWVAFLINVVRAIRHRDGRTDSGVAWLAGALMSVLPFLGSHHAPAVTTTAPHASSTATLQSTAPGLGVLLMTKRRRDTLRTDGSDDLALADVDLSPLHAVHHFLNGATAGVAIVPDDVFALPTLDEDDPVVVLSMSEQPGSTTVAFARPGATLPLPSPLSANQLRQQLVGLPDVRIVFADDEHGLLRALATRGRRTTVVFTGDPQSIDDELRALCVCVSADAVTPPPVVALSMLRSVPQVLGIAQPFVPSLRRRCVEMIAYLSVHHEPVSGERLRTRVLVNADVDASKATLANTATAVRRSLGSDDEGTRLHPVSGAGLYELHGVDCDIRRFHTLIARARRSQGDAALDAIAAALQLIQSEPLAGVTKGYEWFFLEGHLAALQRDGEWAALALAQAATDYGDFDTAFWALRQGITLDPGNDVLRDALYATPRLREFGRDGARRAQHEPVSARGAVAMSWALARFGH